MKLSSAAFFLLAAAALPGPSAAFHTGVSPAAFRASERNVYSSKLCSTPSGEDVAVLEDDKTTTTSKKSLTERLMAKAPQEGQ